jgi:hypothetical protein
MLKSHLQLKFRVCAVRNFLTVTFAPEHARLEGTLHRNLQRVLSPSLNGRYVSAARCKAFLLIFSSTMIFCNFLLVGLHRSLVWGGERTVVSILDFS